MPESIFNHTQLDLKITFHIFRIFIYLSKIKSINQFCLEIKLI